PSTTNRNRQVGLDHRFDATLWITDDFVEENIAMFEKTMSEHSELADSFRGILGLTVFGEKPFQPQDKPESPKPSEEEMKRFKKFRMGMMMVREKYIPRQKGSFSVIAFPSPEIGEKFEEIFEATLEVNSASEDHYRKLQQSLIEALDGADRLHIKGAKDNRTDLTVRLQKPEDPENQTVFLNCLADINIPVGEVFTSPKLEGTSGTLHVEHVKLKNMTFKDLEIVFRDGFTEDVTCGNFDSREKGREFVAQQLLFPHEKLPMGEFAIGTNTLAYEMAMRYGIMDLLPVLLIEKMGPHLAIGDTCFAHEEDHPVKNPDGREVIARDNEMTLARKEDPDSAYTEAHTDISLPYHMIEHIKAITPEGGETWIIRNGEFEPDSLSDLNLPLKRLKS
ncbi:MAG: leucyl aminopeptidase, partial [Candidatus Aegiribacteria sp.]|nr:leucyl aminopeptidase [Candidatus Aegiribacteria sp.]MBD3294127.1 leucyl aminopeptidase [Candidatus Fermentibacteria bacterium]